MRRERSSLFCLRYVTTVTATGRPSARRNELFLVHEITPEVCYGFSHYDTRPEGHRDIMMFMNARFEDIAAFHVIEPDQCQHFFPSFLAMCFNASETLKTHPSFFLSLK